MDVRVGRHSMWKFELAENLELFCLLWYFDLYEPKPYKFVQLYIGYHQLTVVFI